MTDPNRIKQMEKLVAGPLRLLPNRVARFYRGGKMIDEFLGNPNPEDGHLPEEWLGSATRVALGQDQPTEEGLSRVMLPDGQTVTILGLIETFPEAMLGQAHVKAYGHSPALLLKLLDMGSHIPVHAHPNREWAQRHLNSFYGKNEAWVVIGGRSIEGKKPGVWAGFKPGVNREQFQHWVERQDVEAMRAAMHYIETKSGNVVWIPGGVPHALGEGVFALEPQEPTDLGVLAEYATYAELREVDARMGLDWDLALDCFDYTTSEREAFLAQHLCPARVVREIDGNVERNLLCSAAEEFFYAAQMVIASEMEDSGHGRFAIYVVTQGSGEFVGSFGQVPFRRGESFFFPSGLAPYRIVSQSKDLVELYRFQPPLADNQNR